LGWWTWTLPCGGGQVLHTWPLNLWFFPWSANTMLSTHAMRKKNWHKISTPHNPTMVHLTSMCLPWPLLWIINMFWNAYANIIPKHKTMQ
jgi:hypothetical protein